MNQNSSVSFGSDPTVVAGYALAANDRLGAIDFLYENTGPNAAWIKVAQYVGGTSDISGFALVDTGFALVAGGTTTRHYNFVSKTVGFFGSGSTTVNISAVIRNKADLRGGQIDIKAGGRQGWSYDAGFDKKTLTKKWGVLPAVSSSSNTDAGTGAISTGEGL